MSEEANVALAKRNEAVPAIGGTQPVEPRHSVTEA